MDDFTCIELVFRGQGKFVPLLNKTPCHEAKHYLYIQHLYYQRITMWKL